MFVKDKIEKGKRSALPPISFKLALIPYHSSFRPPLFSIPLSLFHSFSWLPSLSLCLCVLVFIQTFGFEWQALLRLCANCTFLWSTFCTPGKDSSSRRVFARTIANAVAFSLLPISQLTDLPPVMLKDISRSFALRWLASHNHTEI